MHLRAVLTLIASCIAFATAQAAEVPFVGCASTIQGEEIVAPQGAAKTIVARPEAAAHLAYYKGEYGPGVLGPRGWNCHVIGGSNGATLYVTPTAFDAGVFFGKPKWRGFSGNAIQLSVADGGTSGRFEVAGAVARVFPADEKFLQSVIAEGLRPASDFPRGPYAKDRLHYVNDHVVEYTTPPMSEGFGTHTWLRANKQSVRGVLIFEKGDADPSLIHLAIRLPPALEPLIPLIVRQVEHGPKS